MIIVAVSVFANSRVHAQDPCLIGKYVVTITSPTAGAMVMPDKDGFFTVKGTITWTGVGNVAPTNIKVTVTPDGGAPTTFNFTDTVITPTAGGGKSVDYSNAKASGKKGKNVVRVQGMDANDKFLLDPCDTDSRNFLRSALCHFFCTARDLKQITERREFIESV